MTKEAEVQLENGARFYFYELRNEYNHRGWEPLARYWAWSITVALYIKPYKEIMNMVRGNSNTKGDCSPSD